LAKDVQVGTGPKGWDLLSECAIWNSEARIEEPKDEDRDKGDTASGAKPELVYEGNVTDQGILKMFA
jgi:hypothetical protein